LNPRLVIQPLAPEDWPAVRAIYLEGIATGMATFETTPPPWEKWDADHLPGARLVAREGSDILGWAALSPVSGRCVYAGVAEVSVYVAAAARRKGVGRALLEELVRVSERSGLWTLQAGIFPENLSSLTLHLRCGFREVGRRERLGKLKNEWHDVILLERRSLKVGVT
jgi:L-amino acid N-acyltransferase YncA